MNIPLLTTKIMNKKPLWNSIQGQIQKTSTLCSMYAFSLVAQFFFSQSQELK